MEPSRFGGSRLMFSPRPMNPVAARRPRLRKGMPLAWMKRISNSSHLILLMMMSFYLPRNWFLLIRIHSLTIMCILFWLKDVLLKKYHFACFISESNVINLSLFWSIFSCKRSNLCSILLMIRCSISLIFWSTSFSTFSKDFAKPVLLLRPGIRDERRGFRLLRKADDPGSNSWLLIGFNGAGVSLVTAEIPNTHKISLSLTLQNYIDQWESSII